MNFFNQFMDAPESSDSSARRSNSDEEVILASNRPKRSAGRKKFRETRHPVYRGVRQRNNDKWVCEVREPNKKTRIWLGTFQTAEMAARAHDVATLALRGRSACLNFADSIWRLPVPNSTDAKDIRKAATDAADAFRPSETEVATQEYSRQDSQDYSRQDSQDYSRQEDMVASTEDVFYMDEATEFGMPGLLANMAEGLLLSPPPMGSWSNCHDDMDSDDTEVSLWSYSI